jgi:hypothetical protein
MSDLPNLIKPYLENEIGPVSLYPNPPDGSTDNALLFSSIFMMLLKTYEPENVPYWIEWWSNIVGKRELMGGVYCRHPRESWPSHWDDHIGVSMASFALRTQHRHEILGHGKQYWGFWGKEFLWRIPLFYLMSRFCSLESLSWLERQCVRLVFSFNMFEPKGETSGKVILFCAYLCLRGWYEDVDKTLTQWMARHHEWYPEDYLAGEFAVYYGDTHPFTVYMRSIFNKTISS